MGSSQSYVERMVVAAAALAAAALFLLLGPYSNFAPSGFLDPWFYTGYFTNFGYLIHHFGPTYFVGRLPWIIPGLLAFRIAPPEAASVMLNVAIVATSLIALYWAVRWHYGRTPAVLACACLLTNPYFMSTVSWDYPDGPAIAYAFVGLAFAVRPNGNRVWVGIFLTLSLLTNLAGAPMIAALLVLVFWRACEWKRDALRLAAGAVGTVLVLCPIAQVLVGRWTYFYWQVYQTIQTFSHPGFLDKMWGTGPAFLLTASRLFAPLLLVAAGPILLVRRKAGDLAWAAWISLAACLALFSLQEFAAHGVALRVSYHSSYLIVPLFFFAGVLLGETGRLSERWAAVAVLLAIALPFTQESLARVLPVWPALLVMGAVTLIARSPWQQLCLIAMLFLASGLDPAISYMWDRPAGHNREVFRSLMTLEGYLNSAVDPERRVQFWIDDEEQGPLYRSADALYLWIHSDFTEDLAHASAAHIRGELKANATLVHLTLHPEVLAARRKLLAARGIAIGNERTAHFPWATVVLQDVTDLSALR